MTAPCNVNVSAPSFCVVRHRDHPVKLNSINPLKSLHATSFRRLNFNRGSDVVCSTNFALCSHCSPVSQTIAANIGESRYNSSPNCFQTFS